MAQKLLEAMRFTPDTAEAIRILAEMEHRNIDEQIRHLLVLGLAEEYERLKQKRCWAPYRALMKRLVQLFEESWEGRK